MKERARDETYETLTQKASTPQTSESLFVPKKEWLTASLSFFFGRGTSPRGKNWTKTWQIRLKVMEAIPNGELFDLITAEGQAMTDGTMRRLVHGIINGMAELCGLSCRGRDMIQWFK